MVKKYLSVEFSSKDKDALKAAEESGNKIYGITVEVQKDCLFESGKSIPCI